MSLSAGNSSSRRKCRFRMSGLDTIPGLHQPDTHSEFLGCPGMDSMPPWILSWAFSSLLHFAPPRPMLPSAQPGLRLVLPSVTQVCPSTAHSYISGLPQHKALPQVLRALGFVLSVLLFTPTPFTGAHSSLLPLPSVCSSSPASHKSSSPLSRQPGMAITQLCSGSAAVLSLLACPLNPYPHRNLPS